MLNRPLSAEWSKTFEFREGISPCIRVSRENIMAQELRARVKFEDIYKSFAVISAKRPSFWKMIDLF